ncbi:MAG: CAP domain-containing protein [Anaerolineales bacterium]
MEDLGELRQTAAKTESARKRAQRWTTLLSTGFLGLAMLSLVVGLTLATAAYGPRVGLQLPLEQMGLLGEIAATLAPPSDGLNGSSSAGSSEAVAAVGLPSPIPTATLIPTATDTPTATRTFTPLYIDTPTPTSTPSSTSTVTVTPSRTLTPSPTLTPSKTSSGAPPPTSTFTATLPPTATSFPDCSPSGNSGFESALLTLINSERESEGLPAYDQHGQLQAAAQIHSTDMACIGFFSHTGSDGSSKEDRVSAQGYAWTSVGENIFAAGDTSPTVPQMAFNWWMASPPNQANILHDEYTDIGIGYIYEPSSPFGGYFTVVFARP